MPKPKKKKHQPELNSVSSIRVTIAGVGALILFTLVAYYPAIEAGFIIDDDKFFLTDQVLKVPEGLWEIWFAPSKNNGVWPYIPITRSTFWLEYQLFGQIPQISHSINIILHLISALLLWLGLKYCKVRGAWLIGVLFALHPVYVQSVAWITERKNVVSAIFYLLSFWSFFYFDQKKCWRWYGVALFLFVCAVLSKTSTIMLPLLLIFCRLWLGFTWKKADMLSLLPFFLVAVAMGYFRIQFELLFFGASDSQFSLSFLERLIIAGHIPFFYVSKLLFPYPLIFTYSKWNIDPAQLAMYMPLMSLLITAMILFWKYQDGWGKSLFLGLGGFLVSLFPVLGFFNNAWTQFSFVADHWVHLPSIPLLILLVQCLLLLLKAIEQREKALALYVNTGLWGVIFLMLGVLTWQQTGLYQNHKTLWQGTLEHNPDAWIAYQELGREALEEEKYQQALHLFDKTLTYKQNHIHTYNNRGVTYVHLDQYQRAIDDFTKALQINSEFDEAYHNRGFVYAHLNKYEQAMDDYNNALRYNKNYVAAYYNRGNLYGILKQPEKAIENYDAALQINPDYAQAYQNRGLLYMRIGQQKQACMDWEKACQLGICQYYHLAQKRKSC
ncbi:MAG: tetratricopeptide repeat protein [SAR324 cluster bacterium]|nr:tetratricopeptide repeat protein [SAR324 cluster bacterium]